MKKNLELVNKVNSLSNVTVNKAVKLVDTDYDRRRKITVAQERIIKELYAENDITMKELAKVFKVSKSAIWGVLNRERKHELRVKSNASRKARGIVNYNYEENKKATANTLAYKKSILVKGISAIAVQ